MAGGLASKASAMQVPAIRIRPLTFVLMTSWGPLVPQARAAIRIAAVAPRSTLRRV